MPFLVYDDMLFHLEGTKLVLGRSSSCDIVLDEAGDVSRHHAIVVDESNDRHSITDCGSANGTFVNDERLDKRRSLRDGDVIRLGGHTALIYKAAPFFEAAGYKLQYASASEQKERQPKEALKTLIHRCPAPKQIRPPRPQSPQ